jgi:hypothetical protein
VFPFATLHPNAGARLRAEISLLPDTLTNSIRDDNIFDPSVSSAPTNDALEVSDVVQESSRGNLEQRDSIPGENGRHFMLLGVLSQIGHGAGHEVDPPASSAPASASDPAPDPVAAPSLPSAASPSPRGASSTNLPAVAPLSPTRQPPMGAGATDRPPLLSSVPGESASASAPPGSSAAPSTYCVDRIFCARSTGRSTSTAAAQYSSPTWHSHSQGLYKWDHQVRQLGLHIRAFHGC